MGSRKSKPSVRDVLLDAPWWVSALLALASYVAFYAVLPAAMASNRVLRGVAGMSRFFAWAPATMFAILGLLAYLRARKRKLASDSAPGSVWPLRKEPTLRVVRTSVPVTRLNSDRAGRIDEASLVSLAKPTEWTIDAIKQLEWKRFEMLCVWYYEALGFTVKTVPYGADGGIDATLYREGREAPIAVVQCKAWRTPVKVEQVRALGGVMHSKKVKRGVFWSLAGFIGQPVRDYASQADILLVDGAGIVERIRALDADKQAKLLALAFEGDYETPTCAACRVKMVERQGKGGLFWGCRNYPRCRVTMVRAAQVLDERRI
ncbi:DNA topoisomerase [Paraburkholderia sp. Tr-20389]|nr:restriction endonuclease [Paraburkholderia sp. Tr-20389]MBN3754807.1 DNA topoisomerase [Paraburkholderia sp. Tr-20389]